MAGVRQFKGCEEALRNQCSLWHHKRLDNKNQAKQRFSFLIGIVGNTDMTWGIFIILLSLFCITLTYLSTWAALWQCCIAAVTQVGGATPWLCSFCFHWVVKIFLSQNNGLYGWYRSKKQFTPSLPVELLKKQVFQENKTIITHEDHFLPAEFLLFPSAHHYLPRRGIKSLLWVVPPIGILMAE